MTYLWVVIICKNMSSTTEISYYDLLGVKKDADANTLKKAWHKLSLKYHPDRLSEKEKISLGDKMKEINEAYDVLSDPQKRQIYDRFGKKGLNERTGEDPMSAHQERNDVVPPIQIALRVDLDGLYTGKTVSVTFPRRDLCTDCDMTGAKDKVRKPCQSCKGTGRVMGHVRRGPFVQPGPVPCDKCKGTCLQPGTILCDSCKGTKTRQETFTVSCDIPPGSCNNDIIEIPDQGHEIPPQLYEHYKQARGLSEIKHGMSPRGDVLLVVQEQEHPVFRRTNTGEADLAINIELTLAEALCGFTRSIDHLDGRKLSIIETSATPHGEIRVIKQEGMPRKSSNMMRGNLLLKFSVKFPTDYDKHAIYQCLTGKSLNDVDFSTPSDHVITHMCSFAETDVEEDDQQHAQTVNCPVQ